MRDTPNSTTADSIRGDGCAFRLRGSVAGRDLSLSVVRGLNRLGCSPESDLMLDHEGISRRHAILVVEPGRAEIIDQQSKNGVFVDGRRVERAVLGAGAVVGLGPLEMVFEAVEPDDALLALEITPAPIADYEPGENETVSIGGYRNRICRWLILVRTFSEILRQPGGGGGEALASLCTGLGADTGHICWFSAAGPEILAASGELDELVLRRMYRSWLMSLESRRDAAPRSYVVSNPSPATCLVVGRAAEPDAPAAGAFALTVLGDFAGRDESHDLLHTILSLFLQWHAPEHAAEPPADTALTFPPDYVRGRSPAIEQLHGQLRHLGRGDLPVLIVGETGVGKEMVARVLHGSSTRRRGPLVAINCAAIPSELLEAELFGIGKNVATGVAARRGRFDQADDGTLLLDEIGEMPQALQAKLLRVLQEGRVEPLGAPAKDIDVRLLAATNADVHALVEDGRFRRDLFFRLAGYVLEVPPLRQRREDIPLLVEHMIRTSSRAIGKQVRGISVRALRALTEEDWPGNVRELEHQVRRLVHLCPENGPIDSTLLLTGRPSPKPGAPREAEAAPATPATPATPAPLASPLSTWQDLDLAAMERDLIFEALRRVDGNQVQAARLLGISRYRLRRRMERYKVVSGIGDSSS